MGKLVFGAVLLGSAFLLMVARAGIAGRPAGRAIRAVALFLAAIGAGFLVFSGIVVIEPGQVGVRHAFGYVDPVPLLPGVRFVPPWSQVERYSTREEQYPQSGREAETIPALSREQMGMNVDVAVRWQIDPQDAPRIFNEIGSEDQIHNVVLNAIRKGVRDGMVQYTINDIQQRDKIAEAMEDRTDSALITRPRTGEGSFRIAKLTAFFLRNLEPPPQVVQAINNKIAQEQQIETERHRVEVARLQSEQQRLLNQTLTSEALTKQYLEVLHDLRTSNNLVLLVPTEGGLPLLDIGALRKNLRER
ncbi:MAG TPA: SPFH domain-containing protein [Gemmatimonadales bacterium]|nr:SPFH domain-containing protein [Gemmatimonadales bacterium]